MRAVAGPRSRFRKYVETMRRVREGERRPLNEDELRKLYALWDEAHASTPAGVGLGPLPSREDLADEFGPEPEPPELVPDVHEKPIEAPSKRKRLGKAYPAAAVAEVIRRVLNEQPSRALRDDVYRDLRSEIPAATTTLIDHVLEQMGDKRRPRHDASGG